MDESLKGFAKCLDQAGHHHWILVTGSLYRVGKVQTRLRDWGGACKPVAPLAAAACTWPAATAFWHHAA